MSKDLFNMRFIQFNSVQGCTITFLPDGGAILFLFMMIRAGGLLQVKVSFVRSSMCKWGCVSKQTVPRRVEEFMTENRTRPACVCVHVCVFVCLYTPLIAGNRPPSEAELTEGF